MILDATESFDPNEEAEFAKQSLSFEWYCEVTSSRGREPCLDNPLNTVEYFGGVWKISARILLVKVYYRFKVVVSNKKKDRKKKIEQTVVLLDADIPIINIKYVICDK